MSVPVLAVAILPLVSGTDLTTGEGKRILEDTLKSLTSRPGCTAVHYGRQIEHPDKLQINIDWTSRQAHADWENDPNYGPFLKNLGTILAGPPNIYHLKIPASAPFSLPGAAPVTECLTFYFEPDHDEAAYTKSFDKFQEEAAKLDTGVTALTGGFGLQEQKHENLGKEGEEGPAKIFGGFIGWPTVEAHLKFRETPEFPGLIKYAREGVKGASVYHVAFEKA
ncbi:hypothetical protein K491DRAFT_688098 [Lophiostoma macrostomum CBS 122681]|uniref:ABM domain-containing protein n=1 Tax=Lophiostoma macrostomum CBS 122681 TaxID=1314788 RepID=A0A6A6TNX7_9PLEO|nr:hypothetical protein K491DRAFT_688098 [Lophiostoma macrostomum CBS 122681]